MHEIYFTLSRIAAIIGFTMFRRGVCAAPKRIFHIFHILFSCILGSGTSSGDVSIMLCRSPRGAWGQMYSRIRVGDGSAMDLYSAARAVPQKGFSAWS